MIWIQVREQNSLAKELREVIYEKLVSISGAAVAHYSRLWRYFTTRTKLLCEGVGSPCMENLRPSLMVEDAILFCSIVQLLNDIRGVYFYIYETVYLFFVKIKRQRAMLNSS